MPPATGHDRHSRRVLIAGLQRRNIPRLGDPDIRAQVPKAVRCTPQLERARDTRCGNRRATQRRYGRDKQMNEAEQHGKQAVIGAM